MTKCALCKFQARTFCESDQAALCWNCDARVHGANFLVARHTRTLLCQACQCKTPWTASGAKLGHTVSVCGGCVNGVHSRNAGGEESGGDRDDDDMPDDDDEADRDEEDDDYSVEDTEDEDVGSDGGDDDVDNQVVPWSSSPPPPTHSSSSSDESVNGMRLLKRTRECSSCTDLPSPESPTDSSSRRRRKVAPTVLRTTQSFISEAASVSSPRPVSSRRVGSGRRVTH